MVGNVSNGKSSQKIALDLQACLSTALSHVTAYMAALSHVTAYMAYVTAYIYIAKLNILYSRNLSKIRYSYIVICSPGDLKIK